ncbi:cation diffusion facilitator family transporter [Leptospira ilyithenensis]|uniref:Cation transporter n=1 Tax=Leptospira ilyithenensis TaxID=2484901 RepID=A0A4R9LLH0_9LEPT|nr:cation diffusion facilitator family transporter [Leptospira ilyithenensis]TGN08412.1 cation transporter [Leptospira ilyithenensis]
MKSEGFELTHSKGRKRRKLLTFLGISGFLSLSIFFIEWFGSKESGSLALFADAGHIATDVFAHVISFSAIFISGKKPSKKFPFGFHRFEVLAALANGLLLVGIAVFILYESYGRIINSTPIHVESMLLYSVIGLVINFISAGLLFRVSKESLNLKSAYLHVLSDLLGTVAVVIGAIIIHLTEYTAIDSVLSLLIAVFILKTSVSVVRESLEILLEAEPSEFEKEHLIEHLLAFQGVKEVTKVQIRKLTSGIYSLELQLLVKEDADRDSITVQTHTLSKSHFGVQFVHVELISEKIKSKLDSVAVQEKEHHIGHSHHGHHH